MKPFLVRLLPNFQSPPRQKRVSVLLNFTLSLVLATSPAMADPKETDISSITASKGVGAIAMQEPAVADTMGFGPAFGKSFPRSTDSSSSPPSQSMPGWFPNAGQTIDELFSLFDQGRAHLADMNDRAYERFLVRGSSEDEARALAYSHVRKSMDKDRAFLNVEGLGRVSFTNIDESPVAEIDHARARTRFLFIDAGLVSKKSTHLRKYVARQNSQKKRHVVLFWLNDQQQPVDVESYRVHEMNSVQGMMHRFRQYFYSFYTRPSKDNVAFGLVCGLINAGIVGVGVSAIKVAFDPSAEFLWAPVMVGGLWSTILGVYSQTYRGWIYNGINRYKETIKTISNTAIFNITLLYAVDLEEANPRGLTIEDPQGALFRDSIEAPPEQGSTNFALFLRAAMGTWMHGWSKVEVGQLFRVFQEARADEEKVRVLKIPFTQIEFYETQRNVNFQIFGNAATQIPRIGDIVGITMMGLPVGTIFFYTYGFAAKGLIQRFARKYYPEEENKLQLENKWRPLVVPFYFGFGRAAWDYLRGRIGVRSDLEGDILPNSGLMDRILQGIHSEESRQRLETRIRQLKHYYMENPIRVFQTSMAKMEEISNEVSHRWVEWRTGAAQESLEARRRERGQVSRFLDQIEAGIKPPAKTSCRSVF